MERNVTTDRDENKQRDIWDREKQKWPFFVTSITLKRQWGPSAVSLLFSQSSSLKWIGEKRIITANNWSGWCDDFHVQYFLTKACLHAETLGVAESSVLCFFPSLHRYITKHTFACTRRSTTMSYGPSSAMIKTCRLHGQKWQRLPLWCPIIHIQVSFLACRKSIMSSHFLSSAPKDQWQILCRSLCMKHEQGICSGMVRPARHRHHNDLN